jgi:hypothetical protein
MKLKALSKKIMVAKTKPILAANLFAPLSVGLFLMSNDCTILLLKKFRKLYFGFKKPLIKKSTSRKKANKKCGNTK